MWRTHKTHRLKLEKETDEKILRSKEIALQYQEPNAAFTQVGIFLNQKKLNKTL